MDGVVRECEGVAESGAKSDAKGAAEAKRGVRKGRLGADEFEDV